MNFSVKVPDNFDWRFYCYYYNDLRLAGINTESRALDHYLRNGCKENRIVNYSTIKTLINSRQILGDIRGIKKSFYDVENQFYYYLTNFGKIKKTDNLLELGSGIGLLAQYLTSFIDTPGSYTGFDLNKNCIEWSQSNIKPPSKSNLKLNFNHICHKIPYPGHIPTIVFPYEDNTFDFVFSSSLILTLTPDESKQYLHEIFRVLKKGGRCLLSYFLWNNYLDIPIGRSNTDIKRVNNCKDYKVIYNSLRETAIAYQEQQIHDWHVETKLPIAEIIYGNWSGTSDELTCADIILCGK